jgi:hypothetical protein
MRANFDVLWQRAIDYLPAYTSPILPPRRTGELSRILGSGWKLRQMLIREVSDHLTATQQNDPELSLEIK